MAADFYTRKSGDMSLTYDEVEPQLSEGFRRYRTRSMDNNYPSTSDIVRYETGMIGKHGYGVLLDLDKVYSVPLSEKYLSNRSYLPTLAFMDIVLKTPLSFERFVSAPEGYWNPALYYIWDVETSEQFEGIMLAQAINPSFDTEFVLFNGVQPDKWIWRAEGAFAGLVKYPNRFAKILHKNASGMRRDMSYIRMMRIATMEYGESVITEIFRRIERESTEITPGEIIRMAASWNEIKEYPLAWAAQMAQDKAPRVIDPSRGENHD